jgi:hypothetical protein
MLTHPTPRSGPSDVVVDPPADGPGAWAGAPSAVVVGDVTYLAYRLRRPVGEGRGYLNVVARSEDGVAFETVAEVRREELGAESLERPALVRTRDGRWRLYVSAATPGSKHWRVDLLEAEDPGRLAAASARTVIAGDDTAGVKDPVLLWERGTWHLWASVHPLADPDHTDRMTTEYATSEDGRAWRWHGTALSGRPRAWDARGTRVTSVLTDGGQLWAAYDGRATAAENWEERTGTARASRRPTGLYGVLTSDPRVAAASPHSPHGLRYVTAVRARDGGLRLYYEVTRPDGAHELRTELA